MGKPIRNILALEVVLVASLASAAYAGEGGVLLHQRLRGLACLGRSF
jgi:hypothetical protein